jgi:hypothetical protein
MKCKLILLGFVLFSWSCENFPEKFDGILFVNESNTNVSIYYGFGEFQGVAYPDTMLPLNKKLLQQDILSGTKKDFTTQTKIEVLFKSLPRDTLSVFILSTDTISIYSWDKVRLENKLLKRYDLSLGDLQKSGFTITYK